MPAHRFAVAILVGALGVGCGGGGDVRGGGMGGGGDGGGANASELSQAEIDGLLFTREEEKLARDVYAALDGYGNPFVNIRGSEQSHMDAVLSLLTAHGLPDPAAGKGVGEFTNADLQALYTDLVAQGSPAATNGLIVGCTIEDLDIRDIDLAKMDVTHPDIAGTYDTLLLGSRNHLRAFHGRLTALGGSYAPQYIDQATFDAIVSSPKEKP